MNDASITLELLKDRAASLEVEISELEENEKYLETREDIFINKKDRMNLQKEYNEVVRQIKELA